MSSSCIPSLLLQSLYIVCLGPELSLGTCKVLDCPSRGLSGQGDLDVEGLVVSQGEEVEGRDGVDRGLINDRCSSLIVELGSGGNRSAAGVGGRCSVHADLEVFSGGSGDRNGMFDFGVDIDGRRGGLGVGRHESEVELMLTLLLVVFLLSFKGCVWWY